MGKIIIHNKSDLEDHVAVIYAARAISDGRQSNGGKQYRYLISFIDNNKNYFIASDLNKNSDKFTIYEGVLGNE
jgi:hypothetical protein